MGSDGSGGAYNWSDMVLVPDCSTTDVQLRAIGALCYDAGVSANMEYAPEGSSADAFIAAEALTTTFKYSNAVKGFNLGSDLGAGLIGMVNPNLDAGNPVILGIWRTQNGHAVICDGYGYSDSTLYHHLNMGWSGIDDAWYNLPNVDAHIQYSTVIACIYNIFISGTGEVISGLVTDISGKPVAGAKVTANSGALQYNAITNKKGIYALEKVPSNETYIIGVMKTGYLFNDQIVTTGTSRDGEKFSGNKWQIDFVGTVAEPRIEISKSVEYYRDQLSRYNIDVTLISDGTIFSASVVAPDEMSYLLQDTGEGKFCTEIIFDTEEQLAAFPSGDWVFTVFYVDGGYKTTSIRYERPGGGNIPLLIQEPVLTFPVLDDANVPFQMTFTWEPVTDPNVTSIDLEWDPLDGIGLRGGISLPPTEIRYGPVSLSPNTGYELSISFNEAYNNENSEDVYYVIDADSEQKYWFYTSEE
jgi:hypothetical protein